MYRRIKYCFKFVDKFFFRENKSDELYNDVYEHAIGSPLNPIKIPYNTDVIYEEPYEGTQQVAVSGSNNLYAALKPHSERTEENKYQSLIDVSPHSASKNDSNFNVVTIEEVIEPVSEGNAGSSETTDRNCEMEVSVGMGRPGYVERLRESFLRKTYN
ncbi:Hypothetical predicted protein [Paramuricea clavata]|uniref:Uncharacterized protein n=1 Tax=Paramuricea clavata TaxID=317549 RepID=A0A6S7LTB0_PARCT|nr:Hypothetical predicted protein [Paramuricea clavata]